MTQLTAEQYQEHLDWLAQRPELAEKNIRFSAGAGRSAMLACFALAILGTIGLAIGATAVNGKHALAALYVPTFALTATAIGSMIFLMIFHLVNAGFHVGFKRQMENIMMVLPWMCIPVVIIAAIEVFGGGILMTWMLDEKQGTFLIEHKAPYLNVPFFLVRVLLYVGIWVFVSTRLYSLSIEQDATGDRWLGQKARFMSGWGVLLTALTLTFAAFDFLMAQDYRFFSTMWGVYYFAGGASSAIAMLILVLAFIRRTGRLEGLVTEEHRADLGKMLFAFTVFWAYIAFSQYFLIWYANIPEETFWFQARQQGGWMNLGILIVVGKFAIPFLLLLFRPLKRNTWMLPVIAVWMLAMHFADFIYIVRPMVYLKDMAESNPGPSGWWVDLAGILAVLGYFLGALIWQINRGTLAPTRDPRMHESLIHKNYVG
ncbi:MAG: hypothetical protein AAGG07_10950 [Planctomycetota bacterium]